MAVMIFALDTGTSSRADEFKYSKDGGSLQRHVTSDLG